MGNGITPFLSPSEDSGGDEDNGPGPMTQAILGALRAWGQRGGLQPVPGAGQPPPKPGSTRGQMPTDLQGQPIAEAPASLDSPQESMDRQAEAQRLLGILPDPNAQPPAGPKGGPAGPKPPPGGSLTGDRAAPAVAGLGVPTKKHNVV